MDECDYDTVYCILYRLGDANYYTVLQYIYYNMITIVLFYFVESESNVELYIGMASTLFVVGNIAIVTGIIACVFWKRRTQSSSKGDHTYYAENDVMLLNGIDAGIFHDRDYLVEYIHVLQLKGYIVQHQCWIIE